MTGGNSDNAAAVLSELALDIAGQPDPADMVRRVVELAAKFIDCAAADIIRTTGGGQLRITASSDPGLSELTETLWRKWPHNLNPANGTAEGRWMSVQRSNYLLQLRAATSLVQELILPLRAGSTDHGYLRLMFTEPRPGANPVLVTALCTHVALALDRAALLNQVHNLQLALDSNRQIGAAAGILMTCQQINYSDALNRMRKASQDSNCKLCDVAAEVLHTGQLPAIGRDRVAQRSERG